MNESKQRQNREAAWLAEHRFQQFLDENVRSNTDVDLLRTECLKRQEHPENYSDQKRLPIMIREIQWRIAKLTRTDYVNVE